MKILLAGASAAEMQEASRVDVPLPVLGVHGSVNIGYNYYAMNLHSSEDEPGGFFRMRHSGPALFRAASF